jgi:hypothetical protein
VNGPDEQKEPPVVAAMASKLASGTPLSELEHDRMLLGLIAAARSKGLSWEQVGEALGVPGWRCKQIVKRLETEVRRQEIAATMTDDCQMPCDPDCEVGPVHCWNWHNPNHKPYWHDPAECDARVLSEQADG